MKKIAKIRVAGITLTRLQDILLPKLMRGEVRVKEEEEVL